MKSYQHFANIPRIVVATGTRYCWGGVLSPSYDLLFLLGYPGDWPAKANSYIKSHAIGQCELCQLYT